MIRTIAEKSAIAAFGFDPPVDPSALIPGLTWSPSAGTFYQYLPATEEEGWMAIRPVTLPQGARSVTVRVLPWPAGGEPDAPVGAIDIVEGGLPQAASERSADEREPGEARHWTPSNQAEFEVDRSLEGLPIYYRETDRGGLGVDALTVLMPAALGGARSDRTAAIVSRFSWAHLWPESAVLAIADPCLQESSKLNGAWFIHSRHDVLAAIAALAARKAEQLRVPADRITFYGSSLGGFGAIAAASALPGSRAVAEVPQIYFRNWMASSVRDVERHLLRMPIADFHARHPERLSLPDRLIHSGNVPSIRLITNPGELRLDEQLEFLEWARTAGLPISGPIELFSTDRVSGHQVLDRSAVRWLVSSQSL